MIEHKTENFSDGREKVTYYRDGIKENIDDQPAEIITYSYGIRKFWYKNGKIHRDNDKPSDIFYIKEDNVWYKSSERWFRNGQVHRDDDKPATVIYYPNGNIKSEIWHLDGIKRRIALDKPSQIKYNINKSINYEAYTDVSGIVFRTNGPSIVEYDSTGIKIREIWFTERMVHRVDGPAEIIYRNNKVKNYTYFLHGHLLPQIKYIRTLYLLRRCIWRYRIKKRKELFNYLVTTNFYENKSDVCNLISTFAY